MKYLALALFTLLVGCGGDAFSSSAADAGGDARDEAPPTESAAETGLDATDASSRADSPTDSSVCTPFSFSYSCYNDHDSLTVPEPAQYCFGTGPNLNTAPLTQVTTPPECQCVETFSCSCIVAHSANFPCSQPSCNEGVQNSKPVLVLSCP